MSNKIIVILGPTATGKSDLAVFLAKKFNGEIISADSRQVYKNLNIGTGKITKKEMGGVKHYLLDVASPKKVWTVTEWRKLALKAVNEIFKKVKTPIICGGTGFYIDSIIKNLSIPEVPPNNDLRKKLNKKTTKELFEILKKLDQDRAKNIDSKNPVRLIRAIEVAKYLGKVPKIKEVKSEFDFLKIGLTLPESTLKAKIKKRLENRLKIGMVNEAKKIHKQGISYKRMRELGLEYGFLADFLEKKISKNELEERLSTAIWHYAKRQITWFKRDIEIKWLEPKQTKEIVKITNDFLKNPQERFPN